MFPPAKITRPGRFLDIAGFLFASLPAASGLAIWLPEDEPTDTTDLAEQATRLVNRMIELADNHEAGNISLYHLAGHLKGSIVALEGLVDQSWLEESRSTFAMAWSVERCSDTRTAECAAR